MIVKFYRPGEFFHTPAGMIYRRYDMPHGPGSKKPGGDPGFEAISYQRFQMSFSRLAFAMASDLLFTCSFE